LNIEFNKSFQEHFVSTLLLGFSTYDVLLKNKDNRRMHILAPFEKEKGGRVVVGGGG